MKHKNRKLRNNENILQRVLLSGEVQIHVQSGVQGLFHLGPAHKHKTQQRVDEDKEFEVLQALLRAHPLGERPLFHDFSLCLAALLLLHDDQLKPKRLGGTQLN